MMCWQLRTRHRNPIAGDDELFIGRSKEKERMAGGISELMNWVWALELQDS
jgi:hypothetical protein